MNAVLLASLLLGLNHGSAPEPLMDQETKPSTPVAMPAEGEEVAVLHTTMGDVVVKFFSDKAPNHVASFKKLVKEGFYDGTRFHRCIPGFMIQGGDPLSKDMDKSDYWGTGGPDFRLKAEFNDIKHVKGILSMARSSDPDSAGSQFFIMVATASSLDHQYSAFGAVVTGLDVVDKIVATGPTDRYANGKVEPKDAIVIKSATLDKWPIKKTE